MLEKVSAASLIRARQQQTRAELLTAITEQLLVDSKRDRDAEVEAMNMRLVRIAAGVAADQSLVAGSGAALRTWRQP